MNKKITSGFFWKLLERFGIFGVQFVLQIVLARLLAPAYYGMLTMMTIFTTLANVFVQTGFNTALVQNKDITEDDYSSVFWVSFGISVILYIGLFFAAPLIANFYDMPEIILPFRVLTLMLIPGSLNSIQLAKVTREMDFRKVFFSNIGGALVAGTIGIIMAYCGFGLWALVAQNLTTVTVACIVMAVTVKWRPRFVCDLKRIKVLFAFGWKLLVSSLIDTLYNDLSNLLVGKKYNESTLGYYNKGMQFPQTLISPINGAIQSVLLSAMSEQQDDRSTVRGMTRRSLTVGSLVIFPMMAGLAGVAEPMIQILLGEEWLPSVPYLQIFCISFAFYHVSSSNLQAMNAMGRSDYFLVLEIIKKVIGIIALCIGVFCFDSPIAIAISAVITVPFGIIVNIYPNKKLINYGVSDQLRDVFPIFAAALLMFLAVYAISFIPVIAILKLAMQIVVGIAIYFALILLFKVESFKYLLNTIKKA